MENRLLLAFVLSLGVFIGWGYIMSLIEGPPSPQVELEKKLAEVPPSINSGISQQIPSSAESKTTRTLPMSKAIGTTASKPDFPGEEATIKVSTKLATYIFTNKGAMIKNILLAKHKTSAGEPIDLVDRKDDAILPLALESNNRQVTNILQNAYYQPSKLSMELLMPAHDDTTRQRS